MNHCVNAECQKVVEGNPYKSFLSCAIYPDVEARWKLGRCPMAPIVPAKIIGNGKVRVGQQKQKKTK